MFDRSLLIRMAHEFHRTDQLLMHGGCIGIACVMCAASFIGLIVILVNLLPAALAWND